MVTPHPWLAKLRSGEFVPPIGKLLGISLLALEDGACTLEMLTDETQYNPLGTLHGGIFCDLGDAAMGYAMLATMPEGESFTTIELKANFFKPIWKGHRLRATARVVKRTRSIGYIECDITDEKGSLAARLSSTCMVLRGDAAKGR